MRRVLALVAAAAMVAGSLAVRSRLDRNQEDAANPLRVVCAAELGPVCDTVRRTTAQVTVEPATTTADRLGRSTAEDAGVDGWLVPAPWPQIVDGRRRQGGQNPLFGDVGPPLARSRLALVVSRALVDRLTPRCGPAIGWKCLGEAAAAAPPQAKPGHPDPTTDGFGALIVGQAAAAFFGRTDDLSTLDLDNPDFDRWFRALERAAPAPVSGASRLNEMLGTNFAAYDAVGAIEAEALPILNAAAASNRVALLYPSPMATADVVLAAGGGASSRRVREVAGGDDVRRALASAGWRVDGVTPRDDVALPPANGLPSPGFLDALRSRAEEVRR
jgi:hypothetical protein